jgi:EAL domain-containing protein (putative c-di-GMP-specific phosphodiesterase class I)
LAASYSSPDCQRQFPLNALKIDPLFVNPMTRNTGNTTVVTA